MQPTCYLKEPRSVEASAFASEGNKIEDKSHHQKDNSDGHQYGEGLHQKADDKQDDTKDNHVRFLSRKNQLEVRGYPVLLSLKPCRSLGNRESAE